MSLVTSSPMDASALRLSFNLLTYPFCARWCVVVVGGEQSVNSGVSVHFLLAAARVPGSCRSCFERITNYITLLDLVCRVTDSVTECMNLGSYNYLGFADDWHETCREDVMDSVNRFAMSTCSPAAETGYTVLHRKLEAMVAKFVGKPDAVIFNMGYGTNISAIPAMMGRGTLIISDALNHTSIVNGSRSSGGTVRVFRHNGT